LFSYAGNQVVSLASTARFTLAHAAYNLALYVCYWCGWAS
jgi:hypothetical protein